ncbi:hypothetical protein SEA_ZENTENO07_39 [Mycobacterium phage Zenteno07]|nr:hypothetical protein SEA_ZENTENO07_39 [Mycobacterium phage Zenteno07]
MAFKDTAREFVISLIEDERTQAVAEKLVGQVITKYVTPILPAVVTAAVDKTMEHVRSIADVNEDGRVDVQDAGRAAHDVIDGLLPPFLKPFLPRWN